MPEGPSAHTLNILVTLPEATPVSQAAALQRIRDRLENERNEMARIAAGLAARTFVVPWLIVPPIDAPNWRGWSIIPPHGPD